MESSTNKSLLGKDHPRDHLRIQAEKTLRWLNLKPVCFRLTQHYFIPCLHTKTNRRMDSFFFAAIQALWLIRFSLNEIPSRSSGCDSSFTLLSIASSPYQVISILGDPGAVSGVDKTFTTNILSTRLTALGSPRMIYIGNIMCTIHRNVQQWYTLNYFNVLLTIPNPFLADDIVSVL